MSNLCHLDVEHGRFGEAEESVADALRISEERDTPICTAYQLGVRARLRLLQGRWRRGRRRRPRRARGPATFPMSQLWPHLVLGMLAARRDGLPANPHLDELWRLVTKLDNPGMVAAAAAALAENAWITRRPDPRLDDPLVDRAVHPGPTPAGTPRSAPCGGGRGASPTPASSRSARPWRPRRVPDDQPYEQALAPLGRRVDRRPAGGAPPARRARRPGGSRPVPRPAARGWASAASRGASRLPPARTRPG